MPITDPEVWPTRNIVRTSVILLAALFAASAFAQAPAASPVTPTAYSLGFLDPLPQDTGASGLKLELRKLQTTSRLMMVVAHPDDEDGGLLTYEARGKGVQTLLMTLTRGEGGQNKTGDTFSDELGILRTLELLAADRYYGVEQRFSRVADFGYSKTAEETFQKWGGHDVPLADIVRVIRQFRPDVLIARFSGTERDGHGHHQASAILTKEAFRAAADPKRFPEQIKEGLLPWQPKKLYIGNVCGFGASTCADENYTVKINTGEEDPVLGMSYFQFAIEGLRHQTSQGLGDLKFPAGDRYAFYKLEDSVVSGTKDDKGHEKDLFDGIENTLPELAKQLPHPQKLHDRLQAVSKMLSQVSVRSEDPTTATTLSAVNGELENLISYARNNFHESPARDRFLDAIGRKRRQADAALNLALSVSLEATISAENGRREAGGERAAATISPGQQIRVQVKFHNGSRSKLWVAQTRLEAFGRPIQLPQKQQLVPVNAGADYYAVSTLQVPESAEYSRPYWHRNDPQRESLNSIDNSRYISLALPRPELEAQVSYAIAPGPVTVVLPLPPLGPSKMVRAEPPPDVAITVPIEVLRRDEQGAAIKVLPAVVPVFSIDIKPAQQVIPLADGSSNIVNVTISSNLSGAPSGDLHLETPSGWLAEPQSLEVDLPDRGAQKDFSFKVVPEKTAEGKAEIRAILKAGGKTYSEGYTPVTREDLGAFYYFEPAVQHESIVDVKVPKDLKVGYIMGAGDDIPAVLQQIGMNVTLIPADKIASTDLAQYGTIVLGVRAYDTHKDLVTNNQKLLDFVSNGGTLIVQNNNSIGDFNSEHLTPYPAELSRARVSVEEAPVQILAPDNPVFHFPNEITQKDFDNWVQERGLYFMSSWDSKFTPLLSCHDPGEPDQKGGMLEAKYGKGTYIFTGYAFFRQLPAGVPGAVRLFVNLVSAGHEGSH